MGVSEVSVGVLDCSVVLSLPEVLEVVLSGESSTAACWLDEQPLKLNAPPCNANCNKSSKFFEIHGFTVLQIAVMFCGKHSVPPLWGDC